MLSVVDVAIIDDEVFNEVGELFESKVSLESCAVAWRIFSGFDEGETFWTARTIPESVSDDEFVIVVLIS